MFPIIPVVNQGNAAAAPAAHSAALPLPSQPKRSNSYPAKTGNDTPPKPTSVPQHQIPGSNISVRKQSDQTLTISRPPSASKSPSFKTPKTTPSSPLIANLGVYPSNVGLQMNVFYDIGCFEATILRLPGSFAPAAQFRGPRPGQTVR